jgi:thiamine biosynthesis lipoprotein ApbE
MVKTLRVIEPFFVVEVGDTFDWNEDTQMYVSSHSEDFNKSDDTDSEINSSYSSNFSISAAYAKNLIEEGYLEPADADAKKNFVNVFDEIQRLTAEYKDQLANLNEDMANMPECVKVERTTVLNNIITVLNHLNGLKK